MAKRAGRVGQACIYPCESGGQKSGNLFDEPSLPLPFDISKLNEPNNRYTAVPHFSWADEVVHE